MNTIIIACCTIENEIRKAITETGCTYPVLWIESGLHLTTGSLRKRLQEELDHIDYVDRIILAFGYCGNELAGLKANNFRMIFPRADDCITILLGSRHERKRISDEKSTYFLTEGWLVNERNIWTEYKETVKRMGKERADRAYGIILKHYKRLGIIDTGAYKLEELQKKVKKIAKDLKLSHEIIPGTLSYLKKLLIGPWDEEFVIINPGETIKIDLLYGAVMQS
jgi:hypothetical protein